MMMKNNKIFFLLNSVTRDKRLKHFEVRIFFCLISYNGFNKIFPSQKTISEMIGVKSIPDISKALNKLCKLGYIFIERRKHKTNIYRINYNIDNINLNDIKVRHPDKNSYIYCCTFIFNKISESDSHCEEEHNFIINLIRSNKTSMLQNTLVLMYLLNIVNNNLVGIKNLNGYLTTSFKNTSYSKIHSIIEQQKENNINHVKTRRNNIKSIGQNRNAEYSRGNIY